MTFVSKRTRVSYDPRAAERLLLAEQVSNRANDPFYRILRKYRPVKIRTPHGLLADAPAPRSFLDACADVLALRTKGE